MNTSPERPRLPPNQQLVKPGHWPYVGEREAGPGSETWQLTIGGMVMDPKRFTLAQLAEFPQTSKLLDIHCVTRWSKYDVEFRGVLLQHLLERAGIDSQAQYISFVARSARKHSTSLKLSDALELGVIVATHVDGEPLPDDHGGPIRSIVPHRYFYKSVKWLERIELLAENRLGFWEASAGYHDHADPWLEQRYMAPNLDRRLARQLIEARDFSRRDLRSIDCSGRNLDLLSAQRASLRDANFSDCSLCGADFREANLSNASFRGAHLKQANFFQADLEGSQFAGAVLDGADLRNCSFFGASFFDFAARSSVQLDAATQIDSDSIDQLTEDQRQALVAAMQSAGCQVQSRQ